MYYLWLGGLSAVCGLVILKSRQDSKVVTTGVCGTALTRPPKERVGVVVTKWGWMSWLVVNGFWGRRCTRSALTPTPPLPFPSPPPPLAPSPHPHAADFKKFQKNFLAVYLVMVMSDWMQVRGTLHVHGCTVACFGNGFVAIVGGGQWVVGFSVEALATTRSHTLQSCVLGVPRLCHWCGWVLSRHSGSRLGGVL